MKIPPSSSLESIQTVFRSLSPVKLVRINCLMARVRRMWLPFTTTAFFKSSTSVCAFSPLIKITIKASWWWIYSLWPIHLRSNEEYKILETKFQLKLFGACFEEILEGWGEILQKKITSLLIREISYQYDRNRVDHFVRRHSILIFGCLICPMPQMRTNLIVHKSDLISTNLLCNKKKQISNFQDGEFSQNKIGVEKGGARIYIESHRLFPH